LYLVCSILEKVTLARYNWEWNYFLLHYPTLFLHTIVGFLRMLSTLSFTKKMTVSHFPSFPLSCSFGYSMSLRLSLR
jgi:hypothetical protein